MFIDYERLPEIFGRLVGGTERDTERSKESPWVSEGLPSKGEDYHLFPTEEIG